MYLRLPNMITALLPKFFRREDLIGLLARRSSIVFIIKVLTVAIGFGLNVLIARLAGSENYGIYNLAIAWIIIVTFILSLGFDRALVRFVASYRANNDWAALHGVLRTGIVVALVTVPVVVGAVVVGLTVPSWNFSQELQSTLVIGFVAVAPLIALNALRTSTLRGFREVGPAEAIDGPMAHTVFLLLLVITDQVVFRIFDVAGSLDARVVMALRGATLFVTFIAGTLWLRRVVPPIINETCATYEVRHWLLTAIPLAAISAITVIMARVDVVMIGFLRPPEDVGYYYAANRIHKLVHFAPAAVNIMLAPLISELYATNKKEVLQDLVTKASWGIFLATFVASAGVVLLGEFVLSLFGPDFTQATPALLVLLVGQVVSALCGPVGVLLMMSGSQNAAAAIVASALVCNIILNSVLIPSYGITGAAVATCASTVFWSLLMLACAYRRLQINTTVFRFAKSSSGG